MATMTTGSPCVVSSTGNDMDCDQQQQKTTSTGRCDGGGGGRHRCRQSIEDIIHVVDGHIREERLLEAARLLRQIEQQQQQQNDDNDDDNDDDGSSRYVLTDAHRRLLHTADVIERSVQEMLSSPEDDEGGEDDNDEEEAGNNDGDGWTKQGESHGEHDFTIYYKVDTSDSGSAKLTCRIESPIPQSLLVPLLSILNESDLYHTWIPSWQRPFRLGIDSSKQLLHDTRGHQIIQVLCNVPWPLSKREALFDVQAVDDIASRGFIIAKMRTVTEEMAKLDLPSTFTVPDVTPGTERAEFDGSVLFRACPVDHPCYESARNKTRQEEDEEEDLVLVQFSMFFDAHMTMVPQSMINFITRSAIGVVWSMLLNVAEQVRDGTRREHCDVIARKADFYEWVVQRVGVLLEMNRQKNENKCCTENTPEEETTGTKVTREEASSDNTTSIRSPSSFQKSNHRRPKIDDPSRSAPTTATFDSQQQQQNSDSTKPWTLQEVLQMSI
mmetsp:Transcript_31492/g.76277  ORF Transcript_31492/g.76277 Transcript_31492/m.76277 type:complete len:497 (-) Transcript_31492:69-1559(-)